MENINSSTTSVEKFSLSTVHTQADCHNGIILLTRRKRNLGNVAAANKGAKWEETVKRKRPMTNGLSAKSGAAIEKQKKVASTLVWIWQRRRRWGPFLQKKVLDADDDSGGDDDDYNYDDNNDKNDSGDDNGSNIDGVDDNNHNDNDNDNNTVIYLTWIADDTAP